MRQRPLRSTAGGNLPSELGRFIGRGGELAQVGRLLESSRIVTVTGVGGVGKSRLVLAAARVAAEEAQERYGDGVRLAELATVRDPALLELALAEALQLTDHTTRPPRTVLTEHLAGKRMLLVLDGFEQLVDECADLVRELLRRCPGLHVLAAGRRPLALDGESTFPLAPPPPEEALALLVERVSAADPAFAVTAENRAALVELCARLDGIPLALELAAGRLRTLSPEQVLARLEDRFALLTGGGAVGSPGTGRCGRPSAGATSCARRRSGCCGRGCRCSPGSSTSTPSNTCARVRMCRWRTCWTWSGSSWPSPC